MQRFLRDGKSIGAGSTGSSVSSSMTRASNSVWLQQGALVRGRGTAPGHVCEGPRAGRAGPEPPGDVVVSPARGRDAAVAQRPGTWWSHQVADGTWCTGQATTTDTTAQPHTTHNHGGAYESL